MACCTSLSHRIVTGMPSVDMLNVVRNGAARGDTADAYNYC